MHRQNSHEQQQLNATNNNTEVGRGRIAVNNLSSPHQTTTTTTATSSELCPGTRRSTNTSSILTSTGIASLDGILGGGVPLQTVMMVREDRLTGYARLMLKYWICQGLASGGQHVFVAAAAAASSASAGVDGNGGAKKNEMTGKDAAPLAVNNNFSAADGHIPHHRELLPIVADLMDMCQGDEDGQEASGSALLDDEDAASSSSASSSLDDKMKIAWRYQNLRPHQSSTSSTSAGMLRSE